MLSGGASAPQSKHLDIAGYSPVQFNTVHADLIVGTLDSAALHSG